MSGQSDFFDYEPLKKAGSKPLKKEEPGISRTAAKPAENQEPEGFTRARKDESFPAEGRLEERPLTGTVASAGVPSIPVAAPLILRRGHMVSFIGLFLFTLLVFVRPYELSPALMWMLRGALVTAIATLIVFIPTQLGLENRITVRTREVNLVLLLLLLALISIPLAADKYLAWESFVDYSKVVVMFIVMVNVVRTEKRLKLLLLMIMVVSVALSIAAVNDYLNGNLSLGGQRIEGVIGGLFSNPNDLALHLVTFFPIVIAFVLAARNPLSKLIYLVLAIILLAGTVVTFSRGGFLGLIAVFAALVWGLGIKNKALIGVVTILLISIFLVIAPSAYRSRLKTTGDDSATARTAELKRSIYLTVRHPLFGVGIGNFVVFSDTEHATHNAYTQVSSEMGVAAGVVYVLFLVAAIKRVRRVPKPKEVKTNKKTLQYLAIGLKAGLIGFMVTSFFASVAYLWYAYYLVGYAVCVGRLAEQSPDLAGYLHTKRDV